ncbi:hypothetical protein FRC06_008433, partial [Ceratobasidium sp. 370]
LQHQLDLEDLKQEVNNNDPAPGNNDHFALGAQDVVEPAPGAREVDLADLLVDLMIELVAAEATNESLDAMNTADDSPPMQALPPEPDRPHQLRCNPPVTIKEWDDPDYNSRPSEASDNDSEPATREDQDPEYVERADVPGLDPNDEPLMDDEHLIGFLEMHLGNLAEEQWIDLSCQIYHYTPLIPQLHALFQNPNTIEKMRWCAESEGRHEDGKFEDVYDGEHYRQPWETMVHNDDGYRFFDNPEDIALGLSTDGFMLLKRWRRGLLTAWPIILINYNLHPRIQTQLENVICVGVVPGPKQCKDLNSFLIPLLEELLRLENGIQESKVTTAGDMGEKEGSYFVLCVFIIIIFGDIPAIAKLLAMKGHNTIFPCRACYTR